MNELLTIMLIAWVSGAMAFVGGQIAYWLPLGQGQHTSQWLHGLVGFGGGILLAAVVFALLPEGMDKLTPGLLALGFVAGGALFCLMDAFLQRKGGSVAQFLAMLMDFLPEAISLGAVFADNRKLGLLLAGFIGIQNLPEGFNSFRELKAAGQNARLVLVTLFAVAFLGPLAAAAGYFLLQDHPGVTAFIMTFAGGGILYLLFEDIAPATTMRNYWLPPMGAVLGFLVGMLGHLFIKG
ncbi:MAG: divalent cation transporter [Pseudomonadota bacterium]|nr:divalent cation transporter [Pseudomonadales bacterium]MDY6921731.1 divalent cation transporter [Pseudomonadota bacterium]